MPAFGFTKRGHFHITFQLLSFLTLLGHLRPTFRENFGLYCRQLFFFQFVYFSNFWIIHTLPKKMAGKCLDSVFVQIVTNIFPQFIPIFGFFHTSFVIKILGNSWLTLKGRVLDYAWFWFHNEGTFFSYFILLSSQLL